MTVIGQPESYSDVLKRIFWSTTITGIACTVWIAAVSPEVKGFLDAWDATASIGIVEGLGASYVLLPLLVAVLARIVVLHDRISDALGLRKHFDVTHILGPLADGTGLTRSHDELTRHRKTAMTRTFYRYASFTDPKIDTQLVRTAADRWAWFWSAIEPISVLLVTAGLFTWEHAWRHVAISVAIALALIGLSASLWPRLKAGAAAQVGEILANPTWKAEIRSAFESSVPRAAVKD